MAVDRVAGSYRAPAVDAYDGEDEPVTVVTGSYTRERGPDLYDGRGI